MAFTHITPQIVDGTRLFYKSDWKVNKGKGLYRSTDPSNVLAQIRLYRYFSNQPHTFGLVNKDDLMQELFADVMHRTEIIIDPLNKHRVGRILRMCVPYRVNFQRPARSNNWTNQQLWRWANSLEIVYGLEHLMMLWLPRTIIADGSSCHTDAEYNEELEILRQQTPTEDLELVQSLIERKIY